MRYNGCQSDPPEKFNQNNPLKPHFRNAQQECGMKNNPWVLSTTTAFITIINPNTTQG
jgi:hypothetical protein